MNYKMCMKCNMTWYWFQESLADKEYVKLSSSVKKKCIQRRNLRETLVTTWVYMKINEIYCCILQNCSHKNTKERLKEDLVEGKWHSAVLSFLVREHYFLFAETERGIWWTKQCQVTVFLILQRFYSGGRWSQWQLYLYIHIQYIYMNILDVLPTVSHHCYMMGSNLPINGLFFLLVFMASPFCYSCLLHLVTGDWLFSSFNKGWSMLCHPACSSLNTLTE